MMIGRRQSSSLFMVLFLSLSTLVISQSSEEEKGESLFVQDGDSRQEIQFQGFSGSFFDVISLLSLVPKAPQTEEPVGEVEYDLEVPFEDYNNEVSNEYIYEEAPNFEEDTSSNSNTPKRRCVSESWKQSL
uniref:Uncharacterized protein n=2 Tax=Lepeophtheirus salmonis TaxID=72036 RepID=A0A0K2TS13_LEPSM